MAPVAAYCISCVLLLSRIPFTRNEIVNVEYGHGNDNVLFLAGVELIFFIVSSEGLCFGCWITEGCFT